MTSILGATTVVVLLAIGALWATRGDQDTSQNSAAPVVIVTATATPTPAPTVTSPTATAEVPVPKPSASDPLAKVQIDSNSIYTPDQQRYLYALRQGLSEDIVSTFEIPLVAAGVGACSALDQAPNDLSQVDAVLAVTGDYLDGSSIPAEYIAIAAATAMCPAHKDFVLASLG